MEHRWGERIGVYIPVRLYSRAYALKHGHVANLSVSGAFIKSDAQFRLLSQVQVKFDLLHQPRHHAPTVDAYVARQYKTGVGIEWCEFGPAPVTRLLRLIAAQRYSPLRRPEPRAATVVARLSAPLLKHGT